MSGSHLEYWFEFLSSYHEAVVGWVGGSVEATDAGAGDHRQLAHRDPVELPIPHAGYQAAEPWRRGRDGEDARHRPPSRADGPPGATTPVRQHIRRSGPTRCRTSVVASAAIVRPTGCSTTRSEGSGAIPVLPRERRVKKYML
jgi:hypothetical protein